MLAAVIYAVGWIFTARLFSRFGVYPEDVGLGFGFLTIRVAFVVAAFGGAIVVVLTMLYRAADAVGYQLKIKQRHLHDTWGFIWAGVLTGALLKWVWDRAVSNLDVVPEHWAVEAVMVMAVFVLVGRPIIKLVYAKPGEPAATHIVRLSVVLKAVNGVLILAGVASLFVVPSLAADSYAARIKDGESVQVLSAPGIAGFTIQEVRVTTTDGQPLADTFESPSCLHLFGSSGGVSVLYDAATDTVVRVPSERINVEHPVANGCSSRLSRQP